MDDEPNTIKERDPVYPEAARFPQSRIPPAPIPALKP